MSNDHTHTAPGWTGAGPKPRMFTLAEANSFEPDDEHYGSTVDNMAAIIGMSEHLRCWRRETIPVPKIDPFQLIDDPDDHEGEAKVESMRDSMRRGVKMPAVITVHQPEARFEYWLAEGRHRYNASHREASPSILSWVAHVGCCGGPTADLAPD